MKKECYLCGNEETAEIEAIPLFSDEDGNDAEEIEYFCKEGKGCNQ